MLGCTLSHTPWPCASSGMLEFIFGGRNEDVEDPTGQMWKQRSRANADGSSRLRASCHSVLSLLAVSFRRHSSCVFLHIDLLGQKYIWVIRNSLHLLFLHLKALINLHPRLTSILSFGHKHLIFFSNTGHMNSNLLAGHINSNSFKNKLGILKGKGEHDNIRCIEMHGL